MMPGGLSSPKSPDDEVKKVVDDVKGSVEEKLGKSLDKYSVVSYKTQVVAGINYFVKVQVGETDHVHLRIYKHFSGDTSLHSISHDKTADEDIVYFQ